MSYGRQEEIVDPLEDTTRYQVPPWIFVAKNETIAVVLDAHKGLYHGLNDIALVMWKLFAGQKTVKEVAHLILSTYEADEAEVLHDVTQFLSTMRENHLLVAQSDVSSCAPSSPHTRVRWQPLLLAACSRLRSILPLPFLEWLEAYLAIADVERQLHECAFEQCIAALERLPADIFISRDHPTARRLEQIVRSVARFLPYKVACLHSYLALCYLLRLRRIQADLVVGASLSPFWGHTWLKSGPDPLQDALFWEIGLGEDTRRERLEQMCVLCSTGNDQPGGALWVE